MATKTGTDAKTFVNEWLTDADEKGVEFNLRPLASDKVILRSEGSEWEVTGATALEDVASAFKALSDAGDERLIGQNPGKAASRIRWQLRAAGAQALGPMREVKPRSTDGTAVTRSKAPAKEPSLAEKREQLQKDLDYARSMVDRIPELEATIEDLDMQIAAQATEALSKLSEQIAALEAQRAALAALIAPAVKVPQNA